MAKFILLFLLALALVSASNTKFSGAAAAAADGDLQQRRETMAEVHRVFSNPELAAAADSDTVHQMASFMKREIGPLGPIFKAIRGMPESTAAEVRTRDQAFDAAKELLVRHFGQLLPGSSAKTADDHDLPRRQQAMEEVVQLGHLDSAAAADAETTHRLGSFLTREMGPLQDIIMAVLKMPESGAKDGAFDAAMELLDSKFRLLLPGRRKADDDIGFAIGKMPENTAAEISAKEKARAELKEIMSYHLGQMLPGGSFNLNDDL